MASLTAIFSVLEEGMATENTKLINAAMLDQKIIKWPSYGQEK